MTVVTVAAGFHASRLEFCSRTKGLRTPPPSPPPPTPPPPPLAPPPPPPAADAAEDDADDDADDDDDDDDDAGKGLEELGGGKGASGEQKSCM